MNQENRIVRLPQVRELTGGLSASTIYRLERAGNFPQRVQLGPNAVGWRYAEVADWIQSRRVPELRTGTDTSAAKGGK